MQKACAPSQINKFLIYQADAKKAGISCLGSSVSCVYSLSKVLTEMLPIVPRRQTIFLLRKSMKNELRNRLFRVGPEALSDAELLSVVLSLGEPSGQAGLRAGLASQIFARYGAWRSLARASRAELLSVEGLGEGRVGALFAVREIAYRLWNERDPKGTFLETIQSSVLYFSDLSFEEDDKIAVVFLTKRREVITRRELSCASSCCKDHLSKEILREALRWNAAGFILCQSQAFGNGNATATAEQTLFAYKLKRLALEMDLQFFDFLILGTLDNYFSFLRDCPNFSRVGAKRLHAVSEKRRSSEVSQLQIPGTEVALS
jgi:DNA repair protein RadC